MKHLLVLLLLTTTLAFAREIRHHGTEEEHQSEEFGIADHQKVSEENQTEMPDEDSDEEDSDEEEMDDEYDEYKIRTEKCLISLAKACDMTRFCHDPERKDLIPIVVGKDKIQGGQCPKVDENVDDFNTAEAQDYCHKKKCSYCDNGAPEEPVDVCFICVDESGLVVEQKEVSANVVCEESYWKRFKHGYYNRKHGHGWWDKHHGQKDKWSKCKKDGEKDYNDIKMTVSSCKSTCSVKEE